MKTKFPECPTAVLLLAVASCFHPDFPSMVSWGAPAPTVIALWPGAVPDETSSTNEERTVMSPKLDRKRVEVTDSTRMLTAVSQPSITIYRPAREKDVSTAVLICP